MVGVIAVGEAGRRERFQFQSQGNCVNGQCTAPTTAPVATVKPVAAVQPTPSPGQKVTVAATANTDTYTCESGQFYRVSPQGQRTKITIVGIDGCKCCAGCKCANGEQKVIAVSHVDKAATDKPVVDPHVSVGWQMIQEHHEADHASDTALPIVHVPTPMDVVEATASNIEHVVSTLTHGLNEHAKAGGNSSGGGGDDAGWNAMQVE